MSEIDIRARILVEATHLFAHRGYGSTSVREVVARAGVTKPTLYYYFANKEALYLEAVGTQFQLMHEIVARALATPGSIHDRVRTFLHEFVTTALANPDGVRLAITATHPMAGQRPEIDIMSVHIQTLQQLEALVARGIAQGEFRSEIDPRFAVGALIGAATHHLKAALQGFDLPDDFPDRILDVYVNGVGVHA